MAPPPPLAGPPQLDAAGLTWAQVAARYRQTQLLLVKRLIQPAPQRGGDGGEGWGYGGLSALFAQRSGKAQIESSWNIEHGGPTLTAPSVLGPAGQPAGDWYVSFILQDPSHGQSAEDSALMAQVSTPTRPWDLSTALPAPLPGC